MKKLVATAILILQICIASILMQGTVMAVNNDTTSISNIEPEALANLVLKPAMGDYYENFQLNYSFLYRLKFNIVNFDARYEYLDRHNRQEFTPYLNSINKNISEMDAFIANISSSLNINSAVVRQGFRLTLTSGQLLNDEGSTKTGRLLADRYWKRHPGNTEDVNDFYNQRPPPILFGNFYPQYISMLSNNYISSISRQANLTISKINQTAAEDKQRQSDIEAARVRLLEEKRLAALKADLDRAESIKKHDLELAQRERIALDKRAEWQRKSSQVYAEFDRIDRIGPGYCDRITNISTGVLEYISNKINVNPRSITYKRSEYFPMIKLNEAFTSNDSIESMLRFEYEKLANAPSCMAIIYTDRGVFQCLAEKTNIKAGNITQCSLW